MIKYKGHRYAEAQQRTAADEAQPLTPGADKKFTLSEGQVDILSRLTMLGIAIMLKQSGIEDADHAKGFDFSLLLRQIPKLLQIVATDRETMRKEVQRITQYGPEVYITRYIQQLRSII